MSDLTSVVVYVRTDGGGAAVEARLHLDDQGAVVIEDATPYRERFLREFACIDPYTHVVYELHDGGPWLANLPANLRGTYLWAQFVPVWEQFTAKQV